MIRIVMKQYQNTSNGILLSKVLQKEEKKIFRFVKCTDLMCPNTSLARHTKLNLVQIS